MSNYTVQGNSGFTQDSLFTSNLENATNIHFENLTSTSGNPLLGEYTETYSTLSFDVGDTTYSYNGEWALVANRLAVVGTISASGTYNSIEVSSGGSTEAVYSGSDFNVDFGTSGDIPLLDLVGNLLELLLDLESGGSGAYANLNTDASPDLVHNAFAGNDTLTGGTGNDTLFGDTGNDTLFGGAGADTMNGGQGTDYMAGGGGNDFYVIDNIGDIVDESTNGSNGTDAVWSASSLNLRDTVHFKGIIENIWLGGSDNINGYGNIFTNVITGNQGSNLLDGGEGADLLRGRGGNDVYVIDNARDIVDETPVGSSGIDAVRSSLTLTNLGDTVHFRGAIENLVLTGNNIASGYGNDLANVIIGNSANNGIYGGLGNDTLTGGAGHDTFRFSAALDGTNNVDTITDFSVLDDTIGLDDAIFTALTATGTLAASAFHVGAAATSAAQHIIYNSANGWLSYDADGNGAGAATHFATVSSGLAMTNADFFVV